MNIQDSLYNLKKTKGWQLICQGADIEDIMLCTKNNTDFSEFIELLYKNNGIPTYDKKLIQKTLLLSRFPNILMSTNMSDYENNIYKRSVEIFELLNIQVPINMKLLFQKLLTFGIMYTDWEQKDKDMQIKILCETFNSYNIFLKELRHKEHISEEDKSTYITCIKVFLNKVLYTLTNLESDWKKILFNYKFKSIGYDKTAHDNMIKYFKSIFWENIYIELVVRKNYGICNYLIQDYINLINQNLIDCSILKDYKLIETVADVYELQSNMISINKELDKKTNYNILYNEKTLVSNFRKIFNRLENLNH